MEDRIFFKDKTEILKGPFTEPQIQDLYRKRWFDSSVQFYFTRNDDIPLDEESGIKLDTLQSVNGFGCPFFKVDEKETRGYKEEKLASIRKEIAEVQKECSAVFFTENMIERMERELEESIVRAKQKEIPNSEENETINRQGETFEEVMEPDCKSDQKKKKKKKKKKSKKNRKNSDEKEDMINEEQNEEEINKDENEVINEDEDLDDEFIEPVLKIGSGNSTHPCYYMRMFEGTGIDPNMDLVRDDVWNSAQSAEKHLAAGNFEKAVNDIVMTVMVHKRSEVVLNKYKQRISPDLYARVVKKISSFRVLAPPICGFLEEDEEDFSPPAKFAPSEISEYRKLREETSEKKISKRVLNAEYTAHSSRLHQIFADCGIDIPRYFQFSYYIIFAIEEELEITRRQLESSSPVNGMDMEELSFLCEEDLPTEYFDLVRNKLHLVLKYLNEYTLSTAIDRREAEQKATEEFTRRRNILEKVFDTLPPEHFTYCLENVPSLKLSLEQYISSTANIRKHPGFEATKPGNTENKQKAKKKKKNIERPDSIPDDAWKQFYDLGRNVSDFVLDAFALFESGDFANWDKERVKNIVSSIDKNNDLVKRYRRNLVCEYVLIERMKEKELFCCLLCEETLFNWKQALIHFAGNLHKKNEKCAINSSIIEGFRRVLNSVTVLPAKLGLSDFQSYVELYTNGGIVTKHDSIPSTDFIEYLNDKYSSLTSIDVNTLTDEQRSAMEYNKLVFEAETLISRAKSEMGREAMDELHEHLGLRETFCRFCYCETGSREEFYAHLHSVIHVHNVNATTRESEDESLNRFCLLTLLVNAHCKEIA